MTSPRAESLTGTSNSSLPSSDSRKRVLVIFGTRPEAIKLCPVIAAFKRPAVAEKLQVVTCVTGQHREMLDQVMRVFEIRPDFDLALMQPEQSLADLSSRLLSVLPGVFSEVKPALTIVQGDTTTTLCGALSSFYAGVEIAHIEAGLRTFDLQAPFPEEMNRVLTSRLTTLHFAATRGAAENLLREGVPSAAIEVTGNTGIDAVLAVSAQLEAGVASGLNLSPGVGKKLVLVTAHRRESFGSELESICSAISTIAERGDVQIVWPVHRNPNVRRPVEAGLRGKANVVLVDPVAYVPFVDLMRRAYFLITDSGGIQEEAPSLGKPVLVLRNKTERPEAVEAGTVKLVGTDRARIVEESERLLEDHEEYERMTRLHNPYGDGRASSRIVRGLLSHFEIPLT